MNADFPGDEDNSLLRAVVAIPARNEAELLPACLRALAGQTLPSGHRIPYGAFGVLLFLNNCTDHSYEIAAQWAPALPFPFRIICRQLPRARSHAGGARRAAMQLAARWLGAQRPNSVLLTTDADSRVSQTWIAENLAALDAGADAVTGDIVLDEAEEARLPELIRTRGLLEAAYGKQLTELASLIDPEPHNPWPHHRTASGASLAIKRTAYERAGGVPALPLGEDKAVIAALKRDDARIRFAPNIQVVTSGRLIGRAVGGTADTMRLRGQDPAAPCDASLEPVAAAVIRAGWRNRLRRLHRDQRLGDPAWKTTLRLTAAQASEVMDLRKFGALWDYVENASPAFRSRLLTPADLPSQIRCAEKLLKRLRRHSSPAGDIETKSFRSMAVDQGHDTA